MAFISQAMNQFVQAPILGLVDMTPSPDVVTCQILPASSATSIQVGDAVKLVSGAGATIIVDKCSGPTDGPVFGVIPYNGRKNIYVAGDLIEVACALSYVHLKASGTVTRGDKVTTTASTTTADPVVATVTVPSTQYVTGVAVDTAATGTLVRIKIAPSLGGAV